ncbi:hypothetical protein BDZ97DRAFT_1856392, partial [Flammula alnicola]
MNSLGRDSRSRTPGLIPSSPLLRPSTISRCTSARQLDAQLRLAEVANPDSLQAGRRKRKDGRRRHKVALVSRWEVDLQWRLMLLLLRLLLVGLLLLILRRRVRLELLLLVLLLLTLGSILLHRLLRPRLRASILHLKRHRRDIKARDHALARRQRRRRGRGRSRRIRESLDVDLHLAFSVFVARE